MMVRRSTRNLRDESACGTVVAWLQANTGAGKSRSLQKWPGTWRLSCSSGQLPPIGAVHPCQHAVLAGESGHVAPHRVQRHLADVGQEDVECGPASILRSNAPGAATPLGLYEALADAGETGDLSWSSPAHWICGGESPIGLHQFPGAVVDRLS